MLSLQSLSTHSVARPSCTKSCFKNKIVGSRENLFLTCCIYSICNFTIIRLHVTTSVFLLNLISELLGFLCACKRNVPCVVNPVSCLGGDKNLTGETVLFCCLSLLEKVLQDLLLQLFMHSSFTAVIDFYNVQSLQSTTLLCLCLNYSHLSDHCG